MLPINFIIIHTFFHTFFASPCNWNQKFSFLTTNVGTWEPARFTITVIGSHSCLFKLIPSNGYEYERAAVAIFNDLYEKKSEREGEWKREVKKIQWSQLVTGCQVTCRETPHHIFLWHLHVTSYLVYLFSISVFPPNALNNIFLISEFLFISRIRWLFPFVYIIIFG